MNLKKLSVAALTALLLAASDGPALASPSISLEVLDSHIVAGESFDVTVTGHFDGIFDNAGLPDSLLFFGFTVDSLVNLVFDSASVNAAYFDDSSYPGNPVGYVNGAHGYGLIDDGTLPAILLATLSFTAGTPATAGAAVIGDPSSDNGFQYLYTGTYAFGDAFSVTVHPSNAPIPEPATLLLLGTGLSGLGLIRHKRKA